MGTACALREANLPRSAPDELRVDAHFARARTPTARVESGYCWWSGNDRALRTTVQESPRGADSARDTGDVLLNKAMVQACHADHVGVPLTRASRGPHNPPGCRPLYEYRTGPAFAQAHLPALDPHGAGCRASPITFVACLTPFPPRSAHPT